MIVSTHSTFVPHGDELGQGVMVREPRHRSGRIGFRESDDGAVLAGSHSLGLVPNSIYSLDVHGSLPMCGCPCGLNCRGEVRAGSREVPSDLRDLYTQHEYIQLTRRIEAAYANYTCPPCPSVLLLLCTWPCLQYCSMDDALGSTIGTIISEENGRLINEGLQWVQPPGLTDSTAMLMVLTHTARRRTYEQQYPHRRQLLREAPFHSDLVSPPPASYPPPAQAVMLHLGQPVQVKPSVERQSTPEEYYQPQPMQAQAAFSQYPPAPNYHPQQQQQHHQQQQPPPIVYNYAHTLSPSYPPSYPPSASPVYYSPHTDGGSSGSPGPGAETMELEGVPSTSHLTPTVALCTACGARRSDLTGAFCQHCGKQQ